MLRTSPSTTLRTSPSTTLRTSQDKLLIGGDGAGAATAQSMMEILDSAGGAAAGAGGYRCTGQVVLVDLLDSLIVKVQKTDHLVYLFGRLTSW